MICCDTRWNRFAYNSSDRLVLLLRDVQARHDRSMQALQGLHQRKELNVQPKAFRVKNAESELRWHRYSIIKLVPLCKGSADINSHVLAEHKEAVAGAVWAVFRISQGHQHFHVPAVNDLRREMVW